MEPVAVLPAAKKHASGLAFSPDGSKLVTGGMNGVLKVWTTDDWALEREVAGHTASVNAIAWTSQGPVTAGTDKTAQLWSVPEWEPSAILGAYTDCAAHGPHVYLRKDRGDRIYLHDLNEAKVTAAVATGIKKICGLWAAGGRVYVGGVGQPMQVRNGHDLSLVGELDRHATASTCFSTTRDNKTLVTGDYEGQIHIWNAKTLAHKHTHLLGPKGYFFATAAPSGKTIAVGREGHVSLFTIDGQELDSHALGIKGVYGVCWAPDGKHFANAAADGNVRVYAAP